MRKEPNHRSEMVNQLLFGETYSVLDEKNNWLNIRSLHDLYEGWIDRNQYAELSEKDLQTINANPFNVAYEIVNTVSGPDSGTAILSGSILSNFDGLNFKIGKERYIYNGQAILPDAGNAIQIEKIALRYLNSPYLWGGRSPFGIDCSGFTQIVFRFMGISLKRDAYQQAEQGTPLNFIEEACPGDLAFFANEDGKIIHVGIILKDQRIIHAAGKVRIDMIDHFGIYNRDANKYTHQLKIIKRLL